MIRRAVRVIYVICTNFIIITGVVLFVLYISGIRPYIVLTGSMEPVIRQDSVCFVSTRTPFDEIMAGDIIAFRAGEMMVTHRAAAVGRDGITTKGDANNTEDTAKVTEQNYIGKTLLSIPAVGKYVKPMRSAKGIAIYADIIIVILLLGKFSEQKKQDDKTLEKVDNDH